MKRLALLALTLAACTPIYIPDTQPDHTPEYEDLNLERLAKMFAALPIDASHLQEVYDAVGASSGNGYDEEYTMDRLIAAPGSGVGSAPGTRSARSYENPLRNLIRDYLESNAPTKASVEDLLEQLSQSDYQLYWPYSEDWDGTTYPIITFDPGFGAESNYGYAISFLEDGTRVADSVYVDEGVAKRRPVWVLNSNSDAAFTPLEFFTKSSAPTLRTGGCEAAANGPEEASGRLWPLRTGGRGASSGPEPEASDIAPQLKHRRLMLKSLKMLRNYDTWFGGASEFWIKCGSADGFVGSTEEELKLFTPSVTDFVVVVKRKHVGKALPFEAILVSDFTSQIDKLAFLVTEDDGGTRTTWKCDATVKIQSKAYGITLDLPYNQKDDIVWRGQLAARFFEEEDVVRGRFGDVEIEFELE